MEWRTSGMHVQFAGRYVGLEATSVAVFRVGTSYKLNPERLLAFCQRPKKLNKNFFRTKPSVIVPVRKFLGGYLPKCFGGGDNETKIVRAIR